MPLLCPFQKVMKLRLAQHHTANNAKAGVGTTSALLQILGSYSLYSLSPGFYSPSCYAVELSIGNVLCMHCLIGHWLYETVEHLKGVMLGKPQFHDLLKWAEQWHRPFLCLL